jgi:hypothetical protein
MAPQKLAGADTVKAGGREGRRTVSQIWRCSYEVAQTGHA